MTLLKVTHFWSNLLAWGTRSFFHLMEAPTVRLQNIKILLHWPSRMQIFEQFDGTIEWKVTERSKGAPPVMKRSEEHPQKLSKCEGASYALKPY